MKHLAAFKFGLRDLFWLSLSVALTILLIKNHFENSATQDALREENSIHEVKIQLRDLEASVSKAQIEILDQSVAEHQRLIELLKNPPEAASNYEFRIETYKQTLADQECKIELLNNRR